MAAILSRSTSRAHLGILFAIGFICVMGTVYLTRLYLMDDTLITLRYSLNFVRYGRPVWNHADLVRPGVGYGYTSILWMMVNALPALFTRNKEMLVAISRLLCIVPVAAIVWMITSRIARMEVPFLARALVVVAIFSVGLYGFHINTGMETMLYCCFVLLTIVSYGQPKRGALPYLFAFLAFLTRPEGALLLPVVCILDLQNKAYRRAALGAGVFLLAALVLGLVMKSEYGHLFPNGYYIKQLHHITRRSVSKTEMFFEAIALPLIPLALLSVYRLKDTIAMRCFYTALLYTGYYLTVMDIMNVSYRFQMPVLVLLTYASLPAIEMLLKDWKRWQLVSAAVLIAAIYCNTVAVKESVHWSAVYGTIVENYTTLGKAMQKYETDDRWLVFDWAGAVPYYSDWDTCEVFGLTDYNLATKRITLTDIIRNPHTEVVIVFQMPTKTLRPQDAEQQLANMEFIPAKDARRAALKDYTIVGNYPVMIDGTQGFGAIRVFSRRPEATKAMFSGVKFTPNRPMSILEEPH